MTVWEFSWLTLMTELEVQKDPSKMTFFQLLVSDEGQNHLPRLPHTPTMYFIITLKELCVQFVIYN